MREVVAPDQPGNLYVRGESLAMGYWCRADATRATFCGEWLRTGDVYARSADGYYTFQGRSNEMIKSGGIWVSPAEVESVLIEHPDVLEVALVGARDEHGLERSTAFVVPREGHEVDPHDLREFCSQCLAGFKRPRHVVVLKELQRPPRGRFAASCCATSW